MEQPLNRSFIISFKISYKAPCGRRCRPLCPARGKQGNPSLSPAYFRTAADFCGIRRNSSKTTADLCRTFSFTAEKKEGAYTPFTTPYFAFVRLGRVFTRFFSCSAHSAFSAAVSSEEEPPVLFLSSAVIYTRWV